MFPDIAMQIALKDVQDIRQFCCHVRTLAEDGHLDEALEIIAGLVAQIIAREDSWGYVFSSRELDDLCLELGQVPLVKPSRPFDPEQTVFLLTAVYGAGGHTRVLRDLVAADPGKKCTILLTNFKHGFREADIRQSIGVLNPNVQIEIAQQSNLAEILRWLQARLGQLRPARTYILNHNYDAAIIAAVQPALIDQLFYFHHCDHSLALGVHLPHAVHVDFNAKGYHHCRQELDVRNGVVWPLVADVVEYRNSGSFTSSSSITTATSGGPNKFDRSYLAESVRYQYDYPSILPLIMEATGGQHFHIGPLEQRILDQISDKLEKHGIDCRKFTHIPWVGNVAHELVERRVDLYIGSFPLGGGRATVEVMGAGIPLLIHENYASVFFTDVKEIYPGALSWRDPDELVARIAGLTPETLAYHSERGRNFYQKGFSFAQLEQALRLTIAGTPPAPPAQPSYSPNSLQRYLDLQASRRTSPHVATGEISSKALAKILLERLIARGKQVLSRYRSPAGKGNERSQAAIARAGAKCQTRRPGRSRD